MAARQLLALASIATLVAGCIQNDGTRWTPLSSFSALSIDQEQELGMEFDRELQRKERVIHGPLVAGFLDDLGQSIVRQVEPQPFFYRFRLIEAPSLNAFAVPGGYVYLHTTTLLKAGSVDELASVVGHEIAHVNAHHLARMQQKSQIPGLLATLAAIAATVVTEEPGILLATVATNVAISLKFSREFETEADELGARYMSRAGFDPVGIEHFFQRILEEDRRLPGEEREGHSTGAPAGRWRSSASA